MSQVVTSDFKRDMVFEADVNGHKITMDSKNDKGPWPKPLMLASLCGCTGMDVVSLFNKMRVSFTSLRILVEADTTEEHPRYYNKVHVVYEIGGKDLPKDSVEKAVRLSQEKYCGVLAIFKKAAKVTYEVRYVQKNITKG